MEKTDYDDLTVCGREIDCIGKPAQEGTTEIVVHFLEEERITRDFTSFSIKHSQQIFA